MQDWAVQLYKSKAWKSCRAAYAQSVGGLCERCLARGVYRPGEIVHHKVWLTRDNVSDPSVTLDWSNLELVCRDCHAQIHDARNRRYKVDALGRVESRDT